MSLDLSTLNGIHWLDADASWRYAHADAMLAQRSKAVLE